MKLVFLLVLILAATIAKPAAAYSDSEAVSRLGQHLSSIEDHARRSRINGGVTMLALGVAGGVGFLIGRNASDLETRNTVAPFLGIAGGIFLLSGTLAFFFPAENETLPSRFRSAAETDLRIKVNMGEDMLRQLAKRAKRQRLISASTGTAAGLGQIIWYAIDPGNTTRDRSWLLYNGTLLAGLSAIYFFVPRQEEEEYEAFETWRGEKRLSWAPHFGVLPTKGFPAPALLWNF